VLWQRKTHAGADLSERVACVLVGRGKRAHELNLLLREHVMIRRLKKDVMKELPPKTRSLVHLLISTPSSRRKAAEMHLDQGSSAGGDAPAGGGVEASEEVHAESSSGSFHLGFEGQVEDGGVQTAGEGVKTLYQQVALAKLPSALQWLACLMRSVGEGEKVVVFAHHRRVMNALHKWALDADVPHVRLDGETSQHLRFLRLRSFRDSAHVRMALVSVTAGGQGVDLSAVWAPPAQAYARKRTRTHTRAHTRTHARTHAHRHARTHAHKHAHTHTHTPTHPHIYTPTHPHTPTSTHHARAHTHTPMREVLLAHTGAGERGGVRGTATGHRMVPAGRGPATQAWAARGQRLVLLPRRTCAQLQRRG